MKRLLNLKFQSCFRFCTYYKDYYYYFNSLINCPYLLNTKILHKLTHTNTHTHSLTHAHILKHTHIHIYLFVSVLIYTFIVNYLLEFSFSHILKYLVISEFLTYSTYMNCNNPKIFSFLSTHGYFWLKFDAIHMKVFTWQFFCFLVNILVLSTFRCRV